MSVNAAFFLLGLNVNGAIASGDFTQAGMAGFAAGSYTLNGASCALGDIIDLAHGDTVFNPATDIDSGGVHRHSLGGGNYQNSTLWLNDPLLGQILTGFTAVFDVILNTDVDLSGSRFSVFFEIFDTYDFGAGLLADRNSQSPNPDRISVNTADDGGSSTAFDGLIGSDGRHKIALTMTSGKVVFSIDGAAVHSLAPHPGTDPLFNGMDFSIGGSADTRIRAFTFYDPVSDADLPGLSAL